MNDDSGDMSHHALYIEMEEIIINEVLRYEKWLDTMKEGLNTIERNKVWKVAMLPSFHKALDVKWVFKMKKTSSGDLLKHKAQLVVKGFN
jgi:hypothetical protein